MLPAQDPLPQADYVVHEWGTFTSMVGQGGVVLDGLHHEEEALPEFVHDLLKVDEWRREKTKLPASRVTQKMETPVLYFYAEQPLTVALTVWFQKGLMTQFYPLPNEVYPTLDVGRAGRVDLAKVDDSYLHWRFDVLPRGTTGDDVPTVAADDPWARARETSANLVRTRPDPGSPARAETEHYLFYRGLGRWQPAVTLRSDTGGKAAFGNGMPQPIPFCLALELGSAGGRYRLGKALPAGDQHTFALADAPWQPDREAFAKEVGAHVLQALVHSGLYVDEARAMVATWSRSWFQRDGARVVYLLPREQTDAVLPLHMDPRPKELVRTMVGRLEFITPEVRQRVEGALRAQAGDDPAAAAAARRELAAFDRFLEPHLRDVQRHGSTAAVRQAATALLAEPPR